MNITRFTLKLLIVGALFGGLRGPAFAQKPDRELVSSQVPIIDRLLEGDTSVRIRELRAPKHTNPYPSAELELRGLADIEELVIIRQVKPQPFLTPSGNWIKTRVTATVGQVLNTDRLALSTGSPISFEVDGGEMIIRGVRVLAGSPPQFDAQRYLIGLQFHPGLKQWQLVKLFEITAKSTIAGPRLRTTPNPSTSKLHGKTLDEGRGCSDKTAVLRWSLCRAGSSSSRLLKKGAARAGGPSVARHPSVAETKRVRQ